MNQENQIKAGDTVRLKSGGLKMTVESVQTNNFVKCHFYNESKAAFESSLFPIIILQIAD